MSDSILYASEHGAAGLSHYLRTGDDATLRRRRWVIGLSLVSTAAMGAVAAMQSGIVKVPPPTKQWLNGSIPNDAPQAYRILSVPDGLLGMVSYAVTAVLAGMGGRGRAATHPLVPLALAAKVAVDSTYAAKLTVDQATKYKAFCLFCLTATAATFATLAFVWPETREAVAALTGKTKLPALAPRLRGALRD